MKHVIRRREDRGTGYLRCMMSDVGGRREEYNIAMDFTVSDQGRIEL